MNSQDHNPQDHQLWQRVARPPASPPIEALDPNDLAAYLDGTADPTLAERIENLMRQDPALLETVTELRLLKHEPLAEMAGSMITAALNLVPEPSEVLSRPSEPSRDRKRLSLSPWRLGLRWSAAAAMVAVACFGGFAFGQQMLVQNQISQQSHSPAGLLEWTDSPADPLLLLSNGDDRQGGQP